MSVDIEEMAMHLDKRRRDDVKAHYDQRHTNATTAFLLCFFLGFIGAHRFYLGQWRSGLTHLALFVLGAASVVTGFLSAAPLNAALFVIGGMLVLASLIWEIIDLGRIDNEIHQRNLLLAEGLIAGALLSDSTAIEETVSKLDEAVHTVEAQSRAASAPAGMITHEDLEQARALAEESGRAAISYHEISNFMVSATPEERAGKSPLLEPATTTERRVSTEPLPTGSEATPVVEVQTHTHSDDGIRVTDIEETNRISGLSAAEAIDLGAAALGAAGAGLGMAEAAQAHEAPASDLASQASIEPAIAQQPEPLGVETPMEPQAKEIAAPAAPRLGGDVTDAGAPEFIEPTSDIAFPSASPGYITLPEEPAPAEPMFASMAYTEPLAEISAADAATEPDIPLYITPQETAPTATPPAEPEPPAESYVPPVPDVYSASAPQPETYTPSWEAQTAPTTDALSYHTAASEPVAAEPTAAEPVAPEPTSPEPAPVEPAAPKMKRIRVKHRIVVEGQVVREETVEREVPADMDMALAAQQIRDELERSAAATPDEIARLANLSTDDEIEVHRHIEGLGQ